jgi:hypothetical protein
MRTGILVLIVMFAGACARSRPEIPADEATSAERSKIEQTASEIESLLRSYGNPTNVRTLPIIITTQNAEILDRNGYCARVDGRPYYIALNRTIFERERNLPLFHLVFSTLLHEFGHCYFSRGHEQTVIYVNGAEFPVSIMYQKNTGEGASPVFSVLQFQNYYVGELIGIRRITSPGDYLNLFTISLK